MAAEGPEPPEEPHACCYCGWDQARKIPEEPTEDDKLTFLVAVESGTRFLKRYELLGGRMQVWFRSLKSYERDAAITQASLNAQRGHVIAPGQYFQTLVDYALVPRTEALQFGPARLGECGRISRGHPARAVCPFRGRRPERGGRN